MCGQLDMPLTKRGRFQAGSAAKHFSSTHFQKIYSSPLSRAFSTAEIIFKDNKITSAELLKEHDTGKYSDIKKSEYIMFHDSRMSEQGLNPDIPFIEGESTSDLYDRSYNWFNQEVLKKENINQTIGVVAHSGSINGIIQRFFSIPIYHFKAFTLGNCGYIEMNFNLNSRKQWTGSISMIKNTH